MASQKRSFGTITRLPSKRYRVRYTGPDGVRTHTAPNTFETKMGAESWLVDCRRLIDSKDWTAEGPAKVEFRQLGDYAEGWLAARTLKPRSRAHYRSLLNQQILPTFGSVAVKHITSDRIRDWHTAMGPKTPTLRAHCYSLLRSILHDAVADGLIPANPCRIRGAGNSKRVHKIKPATLDELADLVAAMPEKYRMMTLLAAWCGLRFGELTELRRPDIDQITGTIHVRRGVVRVDGEVIVDGPKTRAGSRDVAVPPHLMPLLRKHLADNVNGRDGLLFPATDGLSHMAPSSLYKVFYPARTTAGRPDLRWHDLRHTGAVLAAATGATLAELMSRLGHSTAGAAMRYQHAADGRDSIIAARLSELAGAR